MNRRLQLTVCAWIFFVLTLLPTYAIAWNIPTHMVHGSRKATGETLLARDRSVLGCSPKLATRLPMTVKPAISQYIAHRKEGALTFRNDLSVGVKARDFELRSLDGTRFRLSELRKRAYAVLVFGSITCGSTTTQLRAGNPSLGLLYRKYKKRGFEFFLILHREVHPGEHISQRSGYAERVALARRLKKEEKISFLILVDTEDNRVRKLYRAWSNWVFIIDRDGELLYKAAWDSGLNLR